jgi:hypothetical protein
MEQLELILPRKFKEYGLPIYKQYQEAVQTFIDEDEEINALHLWQPAGPNVVKAMMESLNDAKIQSLVSLRLWKIKA